MEEIFKLEKISTRIEQIC